MKQNHISFRGVIAGGLLVFLGPVTSIHAQDDSTPSRVDEAIARRKEEAKAVADREGITKDWWGAGPWLKDRGIRFEAATTFFGQEPLSPDHGSEGDFGGKFDGLLRLDLQKFGLWKGLSLTVHSEYNFGSTTNGLGGTVLPVNVAMQLPGVTSGSRYDTSSLFFTQRFDDTFTLILGKTNLADVAALHPYTGGAGLTGFMNTGLAASPSGAIPPYVYGGALLAKTDRAIFNLGIYGGDNAQGSFSPSGAFDAGFLLAAGVSVPVNPGGLPGKQTLSVIWGDRDPPGLNDFGDIIPPGGIGKLESLDTNRYVMEYSFHQTLNQWSGGRDWGIWGRANMSDNELTAVAWSVSGGVGGHSPFASRDKDRWGLGFFYYSFADYLRDSDTVATPLGDEYGMEFFYNAALTPSIRLTADLQVIEPGVPSNDLVVLLGLRGTVRF